jgi:peptidoglycan/LPS O-acetylase OafA/YrhL
VTITRVGASEAVKRGPLFVVTWLAAGAGAVIGSMLGHYFGSVALRLVALAGGIVGVMAATRLARARRWIPRRAHLPVMLGGFAGFLAAVAVALRTLSSPAGPLLSSLLVGFGALAGALLAPNATEPASVDR